MYGERLARERDQKKRAFLLRKQKIMRATQLKVEQRQRILKQKYQKLQQRALKFKNFRRE